MITLFLLVFVVWPMAGFIWMMMDALDHTSRSWTKNKTITNVVTFMIRVYLNLIKRLGK